MGAVASFTLKKFFGDWVKHDWKNIKASVSDDDKIQVKGLELNLDKLNLLIWNTPFVFTRAHIEHASVRVKLTDLIADGVLDGVHLVLAHKSQGTYRFANSSSSLSENSKDALVLQALEPDSANQADQHSEGVEEAQQHSAMVAHKLLVKSLREFVSAAIQNANITVRNVTLRFVHLNEEDDSEEPKQEETAGMEGAGVGAQDARLDPVTLAYLKKKRRQRRTTRSPRNAQVVARTVVPARFDQTVLTVYLSTFDTRDAHQHTPQSSSQERKSSQESPTPTKPTAQTVYAKTLSFGTFMVAVSRRQDPEAVRHICATPAECCLCGPAAARLGMMGPDTHMMGPDTHSAATSATPCDCKHGSEDPSWAKKDAVSCAAFARLGAVDRRFWFYDIDGCVCHGSLQASDDDEFETAYEHSEDEIATRLGTLELPQAVPNDENRGGGVAEVHGAPSTDGLDRQAYTVDIPVDACVCHDVSALWRASGRHRPHYGHRTYEDHVLLVGTCERLRLDAHGQVSGSEVTGGVPTDQFLMPEPAGLERRASLFNRLQGFFSKSATSQQSPAGHGAGSSSSRSTKRLIPALRNPSATAKIRYDTQSKTQAAPFTASVSVRTVMVRYDPVVSRLLSRWTSSDPAWAHESSESAPSMSRTSEEQKDEKGNEQGELELSASGNASDVQVAVHDLLLVLPYRPARLAGPVERPCGTGQSCMSGMLRGDRVWWRRVVTPTESYISGYTSLSSHFYLHARQLAVNLSAGSDHPWKTVSTQAGGRADEMGRHHGGPVSSDQGHGDVEAGWTSVDDHDDDAFSGDFANPDGDESSGDADTSVGGTADAGSSTSTSTSSNSSVLVTVSDLRMHERLLHSIAHYGCHHQHQFPNSTTPHHTSAGCECACGPVFVDRPLVYYGASDVDSGTPAARPPHALSILVQSGTSLPSGRDALPFRNLFPEAVTGQDTQTRVSVFVAPLLVDLELSMFDRLLEFMASENDASQRIEEYVEVDSKDEGTDHSHRTAEQQQSVTGDEGESGSGVRPGQSQPSPLPAGGDGPAGTSSDAQTPTDDTTPSPSVSDASAEQSAPEEKAGGGGVAVVETPLQLWLLCPSLKLRLRMYGKTRDRPEDQYRPHTRRFLRLSRSGFLIDASMLTANLNATRVPGSHLAVQGMAAPSRELVTRVQVAGARIFALTPEDLHSDAEGPQRHTFAMPPASGCLPTYPSHCYSCDGLSAGGVCEEETKHEEGGDGSEVYALMPLATIWSSVSNPQPQPQHNHTPPQHALGGTPSRDSDGVPSQHSGVGDGETTPSDAAEETKTQASTDSAFHDNPLLMGRMGTCVYSKLVANDRGEHEYDEYSPFFAQKRRLYNTSHSVDGSEEHDGAPTMDDVPSVPSISQSSTMDDSKQRRKVRRMRGQLRDGERDRCLMLNTSTWSVPGQRLGQDHLGPQLEAGPVLVHRPCIEVAVRERTQADASSPEARSFLSNVLRYFLKHVGHAVPWRFRGPAAVSPDSGMRWKGFSRAAFSACASMEVDITAPRLFLQTTGPELHFMQQMLVQSTAVMADIAAFRRDGLAHCTGSGGGFPADYRRAGVLMNVFACSRKPSASASQGSAAAAGSVGSDGPGVVGVLGAGQWHGGAGVAATKHATAISTPHTSPSTAHTSSIVARPAGQGSGPDAVHADTAVGSTDGASVTGGGSSADSPPPSSVASSAVPSSSLGNSASLRVQAATDRDTAALDSEAFRSVSEFSGQDDAMRSVVVNDGAHIEDADFHSVVEEDALARDDVNFHSVVVEGADDSDFRSVVMEHADDSDFHSVMSADEGVFTDDETAAAGHGQPGGFSDDEGDIEGQGEPSGSEAPPSVSSPEPSDDDAFTDVEERDDDDHMLVSGQSRRRNGRAGDAGKVVSGVGSTGDRPEQPPTAQSSASEDSTAIAAGSSGVAPTARIEGPSQPAPSRYAVPDGTSVQTDRAPALQRAGSEDQTSTVGLSVGASLQTALPSTHPPPRLHRGLQNPMASNFSQALEDRVRSFPQPMGVFCGYCGSYTFGAERLPCGCRDRYYRFSSAVRPSPNVNTTVTMQAGEAGLLLHNARSEASFLIEVSRFTLLSAAGVSLEGSSRPRQSHATNFVRIASSHLLLRRYKQCVPHPSMLSHLPSEVLISQYFGSTSLSRHAVPRGSMQQPGDGDSALRAVDVCCVCREPSCRRFKPLSGQSLPDYLPRCPASCPAHRSQHSEAQDQPASEDERERFSFLLNDWAHLYPAVFHHSAARVGADGALVGRSFHRLVAAVDGGVWHKHRGEWVPAPGRTGVELGGWGGGVGGGGPLSTAGDAETFLVQCVISNTTVTRPSHYQLSRHLLRALRDTHQREPFRRTPGPINVSVDRVRTYIKGRGLVLSVCDVSDILGWVDQLVGVVTYDPRTAAQQSAPQPSSASSQDMLGDMLSIANESDRHWFPTLTSAFRSQLWSTFLATTHVQLEQVAVDYNPLGHPARLVLTANELAVGSQLRVYERRLPAPFEDVDMRAYQYSTMSPLACGVQDAYMFLHNASIPPALQTLPAITPPYRLLPCTGPLQHRSTRLADAVDVMSVPDVSGMNDALGCPGCAGYNSSQASAECNLPNWWLSLKGSSGAALFVPPRPLSRHRHSGANHGSDDSQAADLGPHSTGDRTFGPIRGGDSTGGSGSQASWVFDTSSPCGDLPLQVGRVVLQSAQSHLPSLHVPASSMSVGALCTAYALGQRLRWGCAFPSLHLTDAAWDRLQGTRRPSSRWRGSDVRAYSASSGRSLEMALTSNHLFRRVAAIPRLTVEFSGLSMCLKTPVPGGGQWTPVPSSGDASRESKSASHGAGASQDPDRGVHRRLDEDIKTTSAFDSSDADPRYQQLGHVTCDCPMHRRCHQHSAVGGVDSQKSKFALAGLRFDGWESHTLISLLQPTRDSTPLPVSPKHGLCRQLPAALHRFDADLVGSQHAAEASHAPLWFSPRGFRSSLPAPPCGCRSQQLGNCARRTSAELVLSDTERVRAMYYSADVRQVAHPCVAWWGGLEPLDDPLLQVRLAPCQRQLCEPAVCLHAPESLTDCAHRLYTFSQPEVHHEVSARELAPAEVTLYFCVDSLHTFLSLCTFGATSLGVMAEEVAEAEAQAARTHHQHHTDIHHPFDSDHPLTGEASGGDSPPSAEGMRGSAGVIVGGPRSSPVNGTGSAGGGYFGDDQQHPSAPGGPQGQDDTNSGAGVSPPLRDSPRGGVRAGGYSRWNGDSDSDSSESSAFDMHQHAQDDDFDDTSSAAGDVSSDDDVRYLSNAYPQPSVPVQVFEEYDGENRVSPSPTPAISISPVSSPEPLGPVPTAQGNAHMHESSRTALKPFTLLQDYAPRPSYLPVFARRHQQTAPGTLKARCTLLSQVEQVQGVRVTPPGSPVPTAGGGDGDGGHMGESLQQQGSPGNSSEQQQRTAQTPSPNQPSAEETSSLLMQYACAQSTLQLCGLSVRVRLFAGKDFGIQLNERHPLVATYYAETALSVYACCRLSGDSDGDDDDSETASQYRDTTDNTHINSAEGSAGDDRGNRTVNKPSAVSEQLYRNSLRAFPPPFWRPVTQRQPGRYHLPWERVEVMVASVPVVDDGSIPGTPPTPTAIFGQLTSSSDDGEQLDEYLEYEGERYFHSILPESPRAGGEGQSSGSSQQQPGADAVHDPSDGAVRGTEGAGSPVDEDETKAPIASTLDRDFAILQGVQDFSRMPGGRDSPSLGSIAEDARSVDQASVRFGTGGGMRFGTGGGGGGGDGGGGIVDVDEKHSDKNRHSARSRSRSRQPAPLSMFFMDTGGSARRFPGHGNAAPRHYNASGRRVNRPHRPQWDVGTGQFRTDDAMAARERAREDERVLRQWQQRQAQRGNRRAGRPRSRSRQYMVRDPRACPDDTQALDVVMVDVWYRHDSFAPATSVFAGVRTSHPRPKYPPTERRSLSVHDVSVVDCIDKSLILTMVGYNSRLDGRQGELPSPLESMPLTQASRAPVVTRGGAEASGCARQHAHACACVGVHHSLEESLPALCSPENLRDYWKASRHLRVSGLEVDNLLDLEYVITDRSADDTGADSDSESDDGPPLKRRGVRLSVDLAPLMLNLDQYAVHMVLQELKPAWERQDNQVWRDIRCNVALCRGMSPFTHRCFLEEASQDPLQNSARFARRDMLNAVMGPMGHGLFRTPEMAGFAIQRATHYNHYEHVSLSGPDLVVDYHPRELRVGELYAHGSQALGAAAGAAAGALGKLVRRSEPAPTPSPKKREVHILDRSSPSSEKDVTAGGNDGGGGDGKQSCSDDGRSPLEVAYELLLLFPIKDFHLRLPAFHCTEHNGTTTVLQEAAARWQTDLDHKEVAMRYISSIQPIRSVIDVGGAAVDMVIVPFSTLATNQSKFFQNSGRSSSAFLRVLLREASEVSANALGFFNERVLGFLASVLGSGGGGAKRAAPAGESKQVTRPRRNSRRNPTGLQDGVTQAWEVLTAGMVHALRDIAAVPASHFHKSAFHYGVGSTIVALPRAALQVLIGLTDASARVFYGLRNLLDNRAKSSLKYKGRGERE